MRYAVRFDAQNKKSPACIGAMLTMDRGDFFGYLENKSGGVSVRKGLILQVVIAEPIPGVALVSQVKIEEEDIKMPTNRSDQRRLCLRCKG